MPDQSNTIEDEEATANWGGDKVYGPHDNYDEVTAHVTVPTFQSCPNPGTWSSWVGLASDPDQQQLVQNGINSDYGGDYSGVWIWWEELGPIPLKTHNVAFLAHSTGDTIVINEWHTPHHMSYTWNDVTKKMYFPRLNRDADTDYDGHNALFINERYQVTGHPLPPLLKFGSETMSDEWIFWGSQSQNPGLGNPGDQDEDQIDMTNDGTYATGYLTNFSNHTVDSYKETWLHCRNP